MIRHKKSFTLEEAIYLILAAVIIIASIKFFLFDAVLANKNEQQEKPSEEVPLRTVCRLFVQGPKE